MMFLFFHFHYFLFQELTHEIQDQEIVIGKDDSVYENGNLQMVNGSTRSTPSFSKGNIIQLSYKRSMNDDFAYTNNGFNQKAGQVEPKAGECEKPAVTPDDIDIPPPLPSSPPPYE